MNRLTTTLRILGLVGLVPALVVAAVLVVYSIALTSTANDQGLSQFLAMIAAGLGFLWYAACVTLAWIVRGFAKPK